MEQDTGGPTPQEDDILARAEKRCRQARQALDSLGLMERWSPYGKPVLVGAVRYGLAVAPDIDLEIYSENPQISHGFEVMAAVAQLPGVWKIRYSNELDRADQGLYWQIRFRMDDGEVWKVDNWLLAENHPQAHWNERLALALDRALTPETRRAILTIKEALSGQEGVHGIDIYQAVLERGVRSPESFLDWLRTKPTEPFNYWMPPGPVKQSLP
ncbi:MAG: hypothetical protein EHM70_14820 [Chloroflexota bacterium]|nr:MAG: hypothetical protein EHM70_14820 [Chloroflexota bacterium]